MNKMGVNDKKPKATPPSGRHRSLRDLGRALERPASTQRAKGYAFGTLRASRSKRFLARGCPLPRPAAIPRPAPARGSTGGPPGRLHGSRACALWGEGTCYYPPTADFYGGNQSPHTHRLYSG